jgi:LemA protein
VSAALVAVVLVAAVLVFWVIGAYNRLIALRNQVAEAWARMNEALARRGSGVAALAQALREPMAAEAAAIDACVAAFADSQKAAAALNQRPLDESHAEAWVDAEARLQAAAGRLLALLEQHRELMATGSVVEPLAAWHDGQSKLPFARQLCNQAVAAYNEAVAQFPTRLVARGFGLGRAGTL